jgi:hypothetical protein
MFDYVESICKFFGYYDCFNYFICKLSLS